MNKSIKRYLAAAFIAAAAICALLIYLLNKGAPAVKADAYLNVDIVEWNTSELTLGPEDGRVPGMRFVAETDELALFINPDTTEFGVLNKSGGKVWLSNPADRSADPLASTYEKEIIGSQFTLTYRDVMGRINTFSNYKESVMRKQFEIEAIDEGFRVVYTLGDAKLGIDAMPKLISKQRMEEKILANLDEATAKYVGMRYIARKDNPDLLERLDTAVSRELVLKRMLEAFETAGYTLEDLEFDNEENGIEGGSLANRPTFTIPLHVQLDGDSLLVTVPLAEVEENSNFKLRMLNLLGFFGAAGVKDDGYMLVPDGTGALIRLNNGKTNQEQYAQRLYGEDENDNRRRRGQVTESARLPVFGMKSGEEAWFATIEKGDAIATVYADISGRNNSYNQTFAGFMVRGEDLLELYKGDRIEEIQLLTNNIYKGTLQVRYQFLSGEDASYSGMAKLYRNDMESRGKLTPLGEEGALPFYVSILGAVDKRKTILGVPYKGLVPLTTFDQAADMVSRLRTDGVTNVQMRYMGWFNDGLNHEHPAKVKVDGVLGGLSDLRKLGNELHAAGGALYPDVAFQHVFQDDGRFTASADAARFVTREEAERSPYNRAFNSMDRDLGSYYLMSPSKLPYYVDKFIDSYAKVNNDGLALRDLGDKLHADYRVNRIFFRETAKSVVEEQLEKLKNNYPSLLFTGGNAYALSYADHVIDTPMETSGFAITDASVPFYQMVIHGYIDYAGKAINLAEEQDIHKQLLKSIELGAAPHFLWSYDSSSKLKFTPYDTMYSTQYTSWYEAAIELYRQADEALSKLRTVKIDKHLDHGNGVTEIRYENGTSLYINYSDQPATVNGVRIEAKNFSAGGE